MVDPKKKDKKTTRKTPSLVINENSDSLEPANIQIKIQEATDTELKKRGRKPKGGKLIVKPTDENVTDTPANNIILHLRCSLKDLNEYNEIINKQITDPFSYSPAVPTDIMTYNDDLNKFTEYNTTLNYAIPPEPLHNFAYQDSICKKCKTTINAEKDAEKDDEEDDINIKDVNLKLKRIKLQLYKNNIDSTSACFWCTYDFDTPPCYIPKNESDTSISGYGSFCRPECAVGYLMRENLDDSTKFERYHLLNHIYGKVYGFKNNIKPAPNPYYLLDKFYGSLTIQEYRKLLKTEHMLSTIDKPMTRILPELHDDNDEFITNIYSSSTNNNNSKSGGMYKVKRASEKQSGPSKNSIIKNKFGLASN